MKKKALVGGLAIMLGACSSGTPQLVRGPAVDTPTVFLVVDMATGGSKPIDPNTSCESPLLDPRSNTKLTLVRSQDGFGDYEPEEPRYELLEDELLRIDCRNGAPAGRVSR